jgi:hypothetical protein
MRQLERVDLGWCSSVTDNDVKALAKLPTLRELDLSRTLVTKSAHYNPTFECLTHSLLHSFYCLCLSCIWFLRQDMPSVPHWPSVLGGMLST